jgi:hypothetical protein
MKNILLGLFFFTFLISCSQESGGGSKVKIKSGASTLVFPGGVFVIGKKSNGDRFSKRMLGEELDVILPNGSWSLTALAWTGANPFTGELRCGSQNNLDLNGTDKLVNINVSRSGCNFGPAEQRDINQYVKTLKIHTCGNLDQDISQMESFDMFGNMEENNCDNLIGKDQSFKIKLFEFNPTNNPAANKTGGLESGCLGNVTGSSYVSNVTFPIFNLTDKIPFEVIAFEGTNCTGTSKVVSFDMGNAEIAVANKGFFNADDTNVNLFVSSTLCDGSWISSSTPPGGTGTQADPYLVCTKNQLSVLNSSPSTYCADHFLLVNDIDFAGTGNPFCNDSNPFSGSLDGNYYSLKNFSFSRSSNSAGSDDSVGIFKTFRSGLVTNLNIENLTLNVTGTGLHVGGLIGKITTGVGSVSEVSNIKFMGTNTITNSDSSGLSTGGLLGYSEHTSGSGELLRIENVEINPGTTISGKHRAGGIIGSIYKIVSTADVYITDLKFLGNLNGLNAVGGIVGELYGESIKFKNSTVGSIQGRSLITGQAYIGGMTGSASGFSFDNCSAITEIELINSPSSPQKIGGILGWSTAAYSSQVKNCSSDTIFQPPVTVDYVGGVAGFAQNVELKNLSADIDLVGDGNYWGGIAGKTDMSSDVNYAKTNGVIDTSTSSSVNQNRGGIVGYSYGGDVNYAISGVDVVGASSIGGIIGTLDYWGGVSNAISRGVVTQDYGAGSASIGGLIGDVVYNSFIKEAKVHSNVHFANPSCVTCGQLVGTDTGNANYQNILALNSIFNNSNSNISPQAGSGMSFGVAGSDHIVVGDSSTVCTGLLGGGCTTSEYWANIGGKAKLKFYDHWLALGKDSNNDNIPDRAGNMQDPFALANCNDFNKISNNTFLLSMAFELINNLDLSNAACGGAVIPIGGTFGSSGDGLPFTGSIVGNGFQILNPSINTGGSYWTRVGLIRYLGSSAGTFSSRGVVGTFKNPLVINGLDIDVGDYNTDVGAIGLVEEGDVSVKIVNGSITGTCTNCQNIGGVAGRVLSSEIHRSSYQGIIDVNNGNKIGGLIGALEPWFTDYSNIIEESYVDVTRLRGSDYVAGFIGKINPITSTQIKISNNYVWVDKNGTDPGQAEILASSSGSPFAAGFTNDVTNYAETVIENNYVDLLTAGVSATLGTGNLRMFSLYGNNTKINNFIIKSGVETNGGTVDLKNSYNAFENNLDSELWERNPAGRLIHKIQEGY